MVLAIFVKLLCDDSGDDDTLDGSAIDQTVMKTDALTASKTPTF